MEISTTAVFAASAPKLAQRPSNDDGTMSGDAAPAGFSQFAKWAGYVKQIPGVSGSGWRSLSPDNITVYTRGDGWTKLAKNVFNDTFDGMNLILQQRGDDGTGTVPPDGSTPFWEHPAELAKAVGALPGVTDHYVGMLTPGGKATALFVAPDEYMRNNLKMLVRDTLAGVNVLWVEKKPWHVPGRDGPRQA